MPAHRCPICKRRIEFEGALPDAHPFCSERCRMVDLGVWLREGYSIDCDPTPEDLPHDEASSAEE